MLVVGAGAVGQAYALALSRGGAEVSFFIKPHHEARLAPGMPIREVGLLSKGPLTDLSALPRIHDWSDVAATDWHSIWLAVDSTSLAGDWVHELGRARGNASIVLFQTGTSARDHLAVPFLRGAGLRDDSLCRLVDAARAAPARAREGPHMCVWHPRSCAPRCRDQRRPGRSHRRAAARGRTRCPHPRQCSRAGRYGLSGIAAHHRRPRGARLAPGHPDRRTHLRPVLAAIAEAQRITARIHGVSAPPAWLLRPMLVALGARLAPLVAPLDLETYLQCTSPKWVHRCSRTLGPVCCRKMAPRHQR